MDDCGICDSEVLIFFHTAINLVRQLLVSEYSELQITYFEERTNFKYWNDYYTHYYTNYQIKFESLTDAILVCDAFTQRDLCITTIINQLNNLGYSNILPIHLIESLLKKEKSIEDLKEELKSVINNKFFNKL